VIGGIYMQVLLGREEPAAPDAIEPR
jgi:hypothetical protein